jgi:hypothetical protein
VPAMECLIAVMVCLTADESIRGFAEALVLVSAEVLVEAGVGDEAVDFGS